MMHMTRRPSRIDQPLAGPAARRVVRRGALVCALVAALGLTVACSKKAVEAVATDEDVPVAVQAAAVVDTFDTTVVTTGMVSPQAGADWTITAPEAARIAELPHGEGERVQVGDLLVRFEIPSMTADVASREADVASAQARVDATKAAETRTAGLVERGISAQKDLEAAHMDELQAEASLRQAQAALNAANQLHERTTFKARFAGIIAKRMHAVGDLVDAGSAVVEVIDPDRLEVVTAIPVSDLSQVTLGEAARVGDPSGAASEDGTVVSVPAAVDPSSSTANVRVRFTAPTHLRTGTPVAVTIVTERLKKALVIPAVGVVRDGDEVFVMVAGQDDDKAHKTPVTLGPNAGGRVQVKSGLKAGDLVIVRGQDGLPDEAGIVIVK
jgi:RND family efflux transporter MFP subunit